MKYADISGQRFGRLVATVRVGPCQNGGSMWLCQCDCGAECEVALSNLHRKKGGTQSCGCLRKEINAPRPDRLQRRIDSSKRCYEKRKFGGYCVKCGKLAPLKSGTIWCDGCADKHRWQTRKRLMGITQELFWQVFESQNGCCAICLDLLPVEEHNIHVDHDHKTGHYRGLLCGSCNWGLGQFRDNPDTCARAADYLRLHYAVRQSDTK